MPQPAASNFTFADWVATECVRLLTNSREAFQYATHDLEAEFKKDFQIGDKVTYKYPQMYNVIDGPEFGGGGLNRRTGQANVSEWCQIPFEVSTWDKMFKMEKSKKDISKNYLQSAMEQMLVEAEGRFMRFMFLNTNNVVGALGTTPTTWATYAGADTRLFQLAGLQGEQGNIVTAKMMETLTANSLLQLIAPDELTRQYKKNMVGTAAGANWHRSQACRAHTSGIWATVATGVTVTTSGQSGTTLNVTCTTGDTFKAGDIIALPQNAVNPWNRLSTGNPAQFKIMADATGVANAAALTIFPGIVGPGSPEQNIVSLPLAADVVTLWPGTTMADATAKSGVLAIRTNKNAFGVICAEIPMPPQGGSIIMSAHDTDPDSKMSVALMQFFDPVSHKWGFRYDCVFGFAKIYAERAACLIAGLQ